MKNIVIKNLEKYNDDNYQEIAFNVYKNKSYNNYSFAYECELEEGEGQYPLEDLLDMYKVSCCDYYGEEFEENGVKKSIVEVVTLSDKIDELISILNYSTILGKQINNFVYNNYVKLGINYGDGKLLINNTEHIIPIYALRERKEIENFCKRYPEGQLTTMFVKGVDISEHTKEIDELKYVMIKDRCAYVVYRKDNQDYQLVYDIKGFVKDELIP